MKKKMIRFLLVFILLAGVGVGILVANINPILESLRPTLVAKISQAMSRQVTVGKIQLRLFPSTALSIENVALEGGDNVASVETLFLSASLSSILKRNIEITGIELDGVNVDITKSKNADVTVGKPASADSNTADGKNSISFGIKSAEVRRLNFNFVDKSTDPAKKVSLANVSASLKDFALGQDGKFRFNFSLDGKDSEIAIDNKFQKKKGENFSLKVIGSVGMPLNLNLETLDITLADNSLSLPLSFDMSKKNLSGKVLTKNFNLESLAALLPELANYSLKGAVDLTQNYALEMLADRPPTPKEFSGSLELKNVSAAVPTKSIEMSSLSGKVDLQKEEITAKPLSFIIYGQKVDLGLKIFTPFNFSSNVKVAAASKIFGGEITSEVKLENQKLLATLTKANNLDLGQIIATFKPAAKVLLTGNLQSLSAQIGGNTENLKASMAGPVNLKIVKGSIEGVNIFQKTLGKVTEIPGLGAALASYVPEKYRPLLQGDSTAFDSLLVDAVVNGGNTQVKNLALVHSAYAVRGSGQIFANGDMRFSTQFKLSADLASEMVARESKLKLLLDEDGGIVFPLIISRSEGLFLLLPDISQLAKSALKNTAKEAATKALDKVAPGLGGVGKALDSLFK